MLATKPLKSELMTRKGPANRNLTYLSGDSVTRTLNDIFGFDGWCLEVKETRRESCEKDDRERYNVSYTSTVRVTHRQSGAFKEDCGAGDSTDKSLATAVNHALKASVTDALKRAVRHFGDKLGNSLYDGSFNISKAPRTLKDALNHYEIDRAKSKFGFEKDRIKDHVQQQDQKLPGLNGSSDLNTSTTSASTRTAHSLHASSPVTHGSSSMVSISATSVAKSYGHSHIPVRQSSTTTSVAGTNVNTNPNSNGTSKASQSIANGAKTVVSTSVQNKHSGNNINSNAKASAVNINRYNSSGTCSGSADTSNIIVPTKSVTVTASNASGYNSGHYVSPSAAMSGSTGTSASTVVCTNKPSGNTSSANGHNSDANNIHALQATGKSPNGLNRFQRNPANNNPNQPQFRSTRAAVTAQAAIGVGIDAAAAAVTGTIPTTNTHGPSFAKGSRPNSSSSITRQYQPTNSSVPAPGQVANALLDITTSRTSNTGMEGAAQNSNGKRNIDGDGSGIGRSGSLAKKMVPYNGTNPYLNSKK